MKKAFYFILGLSLVILTSATTSSVITVKPAPPKQFFVKNFSDVYDCEAVGVFIREQIKKGWILKAVEASNKGQYSSTWVVVMEKY